MFYERNGLTLNCMWQLVVHENIHYLNQTWKIDNKHTLSADIKFICTRFRKHGEKLAWDKLFIPVSSTNKFYISKQFVYIMFILQCPAYKKLFNLHTKRQKHWTKLYMYTFIKTVCVLIAVWYIAKVYVIFPVWPVSFALCSTQDTGYQRLYTSSRRIKQRFICTPLYRQ